MSTTGDEPSLRRPPGRARRRRHRACDDRRVQPRHRSCAGDGAHHHRPAHGCRRHHGDLHGRSAHTGVAHDRGDRPGLPPRVDPGAELPRRHGAVRPNLRPGPVEAWVRRCHHPDRRVDRDQHAAPGVRVGLRSPAAEQRVRRPRAALRTLFTGVHLAGPELTPETFRDGLFRYPPSGGDPTAPTISRGDHGLWPEVDYADVDSVAHIWWDPAAEGADEAGDLTCLETAPVTSS
jgi:hypothetical protein